ncbi:MULTISPECIES: acyltransferase [Bradyrhizobium]|jgi:acetyltransferase-like isoleucine patch superfamily enzyme|uniref:acyltransferase n=1 Tax=Bradyrhizobium TaxID=374 RepID=UPI00293F03D3|nr:DapH/DapD/GlmU-related protein [Bradyrhizobium sp. NDS-1]WOH75875.1 DapH/DapD/GlmU-related protein [Bradyrhizobium sp. NDS-1]WOH75929.1 DapH/DapD/GlmU-related protein [Bradyrhizobium sp. NDS-1]
MNLNFLIQRFTGRNVDYMVQRMVGRATCRLGAGAVLGADARMRNIYGDTDKIDIGAQSRIFGELMTFAHGGQIRIGEWCYVGEGTRIWSAASIEIGNRVLISHSANVFDSLTHPIGAAARHEQVRQIFTSGHPRELSLDEAPVRICDDAWVGAGAMVLRGVTVGEGAVVAAGAVVTKDVPAFSIVAGNPAVLVRELRPDER